MCVETSRNTKRQKTTQGVSGGGSSKPGNSRRLTGRLSLIMTMPVDVFCEIACQMTPADLLSMARSSKSLRELLMSKSSKQIWRAAEDAVGLPECPPDLSSPQYASLIFDKFCMVRFLSFMLCPTI
ncbi:hypothetical protein DFH11DRAFT_1506935 [Phellopilus nigrolimitatus]|nr:hypothetical protein DFH11DRAFT_1506935 [Phellopilus nigrolimitatus]